MSKDLSEDFHQDEADAAANITLTALAIATASTIGVVISVALLITYLVNGSAL